MTDERLPMDYISNRPYWTLLIFILLMCCHLLMNADPAGLQLCSQVIIMYEKQGTISDDMIVFMCLWQEPISVKLLVKLEVPGYWLVSWTCLITISIKKKTLERLSLNTLLNHSNKFVSSHNGMYACFAFVMISCSCALRCIIRL